MKKQTDILDRSDNYLLTLPMTAQRELEYKELQLARRESLPGLTLCRIYRGPRDGNNHATLRKNATHFDVYLRQIYNYDYSTPKLRIDIKGWIITTTSIDLNNLSEINRQLKNVLTNYAFPANYIGCEIKAQ